MGAQAMALFLLGQMDVSRDACVIMGVALHYALLSTFSLMARQS